jgi:hypothetical protein
MSQRSLQMSKFEEILLELLEAAVVSAPAALPLVVHSPRGILVANASESFAATFLARVAQPSPPAPFLPEVPGPRIVPRADNASLESPLRGDSLIPTAEQSQGSDPGVPPFTGGSAGQDPPQPDAPLQAEAPAAPAGAVSYHQPLR